MDKNDEIIKEKIKVLKYLPIEILLRVRKYLSIQTCRDATLSVLQKNVSLIISFEGYQISLQHVEDFWITEKALDFLHRGHILLSKFRLPAL
jgi:hypothetical protein